MENKEESEDKNFYEDIIKKTKTGVTFPKELREALFDDEKEAFFKLIVPKEKDKIILEFLSQEEVKNLSEPLKTTKSKN